MAVVTVLNGALAANTPGAWVAVPSSRAYTIQIVTSAGNPMAFDISVDGVNAMPLNQNPKLISSSGSEPRAFSLVDVPIAWMRANNVSGASATAVVSVQAQ